MIERKLGVDVPGPEPEVAITTTDLGRVQFHVLLFCPTQVVKTIETEITKRFLDAINYGDIPRPASEKSEKTA